MLLEKEDASMQQAITGRVDVPHHTIQGYNEHIFV